MDRKAMYKLSYGLFILTAKEAEKDNGCIINTAIQAASEPNQLSICVNKANCSNILASNQEEIPISLKPLSSVPGAQMVFIILQKVQMHTFL